MVQFYQKVKAKIRTEILNVRFSTVPLKPTPDDFWHLKDLTIYWQNQAAFHHRAVCSCMSHWIGMFPLIHYPLALSWFFKSSQARTAVPTRIGPPWHRFATSIPPPHLGHHSVGNVRIMVVAATPQISAMSHTGRNSSTRWLMCRIPA